MGYQKTNKQKQNKTKQKIKQKNMFNLPHVDFNFLKISWLIIDHQYLVLLCDKVGPRVYFLCELCCLATGDNK